MKFVVVALLLAVAFVAAETDPNKGETILTNVAGGNTAAGETLMKPAADQTKDCACGVTNNACNPCGAAAPAAAPAAGTTTVAPVSTAPAAPTTGPSGKPLVAVKVESSRSSGPCCCSCNNCAGCVVATTCGCQAQPEYVAPEIREVATCNCCGQASCSCCANKVFTQNNCGCCGQASCGCCSQQSIKPELRDANVQPEIKERCPCYFTQVQPCACAARFAELLPNTAVVGGVKL